MGKFEFIKTDEKGSCTVLAHTNRLDICNFSSSIGQLISIDYKLYQVVAIIPDYEISEKDGEYFAEYNYDLVYLIEKKDLTMDLKISKEDLND